jgi:hypothetical protein
VVCGLVQQQQRGLDVERARKAVGAHEGVARQTSWGSFCRVFVPSSCCTTGCVGCGRCWCRGGQDHDLTNQQKPRARTTAQTPPPT